MEKPVLAIAIDFGTTFSGLTYMLLGRNELLCHLDRWPGGPGKLNKVPTVISYEKSRSGYWLPSTFGFAAEEAPANQRCSMFKMCLDENSAETNSDPTLAPTFVNLGKTVTDVVKDFIQLMYQHMLDTFEDQGYSPDDLVYDVLFTVPAQFEVREVDRFKSIILSTGFGIHKVSVSLREPEAAILYTINHGLKALMPQNECIVLCDAGGGTVDIASYKVAQTTPRVKIEQVDIVSGGPFGSIHIDRKFRNWLYQECISDEWRAFFQTSAEARTHIQRMAQRFIGRKEVFENSAATPYINIEVSPPNLSGPYIQNGMIRVSREKMCEFFEGSVEGTIDCLRTHLQKCIKMGFSIKSIFLVGGLGSSPYLHSKVKEFASGFRGKIRVVQPPNAEYAVIRGAIETHQASLLGDEDQISVRICPASYGIKMSSVWNDARHNLRLDQQYVSPLTKQVMAANQVAWLIKKGDKITGEKMKEVREAFVRDFEKAPEAVWSDNIVMCDLDHPPYRVTKDVKPVCVLKSDMTGLPSDIFDKKKSDDRGIFGRKKYYHAEFDIIVKVGLTDLDFSLVYKEKVRSDLLKVTFEKPRA